MHSTPQIGNRSFVRCFVLRTPDALSQHLNLLRERASRGGTRRVPRVAYNVFRSGFVAPAKEEGIEEVVEVPFAPHFGSEREREMFRWHT
eukprot:1192444-Prorocentrum_minimum.AAC.4